MCEAQGESKTLILLLDGTWNDADYGARDTNIVRLRELISKSMHHQPNSPTDVGAGIQAGRAKHRTSIVLYQRGIGTNAFDKVRGGAFGAGLNDNVRDAYRFICANYTPNDKIFIFGFSRGAFTARSLAGYVAAAGILKSETCTPENESRAWYYYRERPARRMSGIAATLREFVHTDQHTPITCLGVFDTVGSLGVPFRYFSRLNRSLYEFHDVYLSNVSEVNLHAIAIDEHRWPFEATLWKASKFSPSNNLTEQVWFPGSHSDVGGGNVVEAARSSAPHLDDIPLDWMLKRINSLPQTQPYFPTTSTVNATRTESPLPPQVEARKRFYRLFPFAHRTIGNAPLDTTIHSVNVGFDRHAAAQGEAIHISAIERFGRMVCIDGQTRSYRPRNLYAYLQAQQSGKARHLPIVDWDGSAINDARANELIRLAMSRQ